MSATLLPRDTVKPLIWVCEIVVVRFMSLEAQWSADGWFVRLAACRLKPKPCIPDRAPPEMLRFQCSGAPTDVMHSFAFSSLCTPSSPLASRCLRP